MTEVIKGDDIMKKDKYYYYSKIKLLILSFLMITPLFFELKINSLTKICKYLGIQNNADLLKNISYKLQILIGDFLMSFHGQTIIMLCVYVVAIICLMKYQKIKDKRLIKTTVIPSLLFAFFEVFGKSFQQTNSWNLVFKNYRTILKGGFLFLGYFVLFMVVIGFLFYFLKQYRFPEKNKDVSWFTDNKKSILIVMGIILLFWSFSLIANFPGITNYDFFDMLNSYYGNETYSLRAVTLIDPSVTLNNNNPVLQTLLAVGCMKIGTIFGAPWFGLFLFCYSQAVLFALILSYVIYYLAKIGVHKFLRIGLLLVFGLAPMNANYAVTTLKDVNFAFVFLLYMICLIEIVRNPQVFFNNKKKLLCFSGINLLLMLLRNNGAYVLVPTDIVLFILYRKYWKEAMVSTLIPAFIFVVLISNVLYPALKIAPGSKREMYSVPFQQTARLVKEHGDEIPQEDKEIIDKILSYDKIATKYEPELSDKVKATYKKYSTSEEMSDYLSVWAKWLFIHPETYIQATMNNCYGYFYPEAKSWIAYTQITPPGKEYGLSSPKVLSGAREFVNAIPEIVRDIPIIGLIESIGFYTWLMVLSISYLIYIHKKKYIFLYTPLLVLLLTCILSPANTMLRYIYPMILSVPILICYILHIQFEEGCE